MSKYNDRDIPEPETLRDAYRNRLSPASSQTMTIDKHMKDDWDFKLTPPRELNEEQKKIWNAAYEPKTKLSMRQSWKGMISSDGNISVMPRITSDVLTRWMKTLAVSLITLIKGIGGEYHSDLFL